MRNYEVTIGIPVYNAEKYIRKTLESVLNQSFEDIEILLIDDRGTDATMDIVNEIKTSHPRGKDIRIVTQPQNAGVAQARNRIIDEARGRYLYFLDSDDIIPVDCISLLHSTLKNHNAEVVFGSYEKIELFNNNPTPILYQYPKAILDSADEFAEFAYRKYGGIQASACNYLISVDVLRSNNHKFMNSKYWEDMVFTFDLAPLIKRAVMLPDITYSYLCHENSLSNYQIRDSISKTEILSNVNSVEELKKTSKNLIGKSYLGNRCYNIVMTDFYIVCNAIKNKAIILPALSDKELKSFMRHPLTLWQILKMEKGRLKNLLLYFLGVIPAFLSLFIIKNVGKRKGLI